MSSIRIGDTVVLRSGGPVMTVGDIDSLNARFLVVWFIDADVHSAWLDPQTLLTCPVPADDSEAPYMDYDMGEYGYDPEMEYEDDPDDPYDDYAERMREYKSELTLIVQDLLDDAEQYSDAHSNGWFYPDTDADELHEDGDDDWDLEEDATSNDDDDPYS